MDSVFIICRTLKLRHAVSWRDGCEAAGVTDNCIVCSAWFGGAINSPKSRCIHTPKFELFNFKNDALSDFGTAAPSHTR